ncbi:DUF4360 domain-containing protein, partial [Microcoleus sp. B4-D1]|uniref:DUF4360 domain-containing protein n=2 Tax=Microcoleus TaxID=44471 RepID=UPI002FD62202
PSKKDGRDAHPTITIKIVSYLIRDPKPVLNRNLRGQTNYNVRDSLATIANVWSRCGDSVNMRVNAAMTARGAGMATVDSFDLAHRGLVDRVKYRTCR